MKTEWETKNLGEVIQLEYGKPLPDSKRKSTGKYPVYGANGEKDRTDEYFHDEPSIIVGRKGSAGEINLTEDRFWPLDVTYFVKFDRKQYVLGFLYNLLYSLELQKLAKGVKPGINRNEVYAITAKFPPLPEQKRIVAILDEAFSGIARAKEIAEKNLANAREIFESYLQSIFAKPNSGWEQKKLSELGIITSSKRIYKEEYVESGIPFYRTKEIKELANEKDISVELFISKQRYKEIKEKFGVPQINDILLTAIGTIGEIWVVNNGSPFYFKDGNVLWFKEFKDVNPYFLRYVLLAFVDNLKKLSHGAAYNALPIEKLNEHRIFFPTNLKEQQNITAKLDDIAEQTIKMSELYNRKLAALEELKKSLLHKAFSGKL